ncbi:hypothetical protein [Aquimonas sp.]|jgi:hypothetical protein|uniref:hypothetical protein n=1 Tax=Aquimonas sp. TaxID=1872588 RepID=UPI0037C11453
MSLLSASELAWYATGRFYRAADGSLADYGYFLHLPFPDCRMFSGAPGETTAHFTFAAQPFKGRTASNGSLSLALDAVGEFSLYLQRIPGGNFDSPASFAQGERIAVFRRSTMVVDTTLSASASPTAAPTPVLIANLFTAWLIDSSPFELQGTRYDLGAAVGRGVTQFGFAATTPVVPAPSGYTAVVPFTGSAMALGR